MKSTAHRHWFRFAFSLRTMFVVVTLAAFAIPTARIIEAHYGIAQARRKLKQMQDEIAAKERLSAATTIVFPPRPAAPAP